MTSSARAFGSASTLKMRPWAAALHGLALARTGSRDTALTTIREAESAAAELLASNPESYALWYEAAFAVAGRTVLTGSSGSDVIDRYSEAMRRCRSAGVVLSAQRLLTEWKPLDTCSVLDETLRALCVDVALGPHDRDRSWPGPTFAPNG